ncbi:MAG: hypothetical protein U0703_20120 [Anaerolineae bacterium]
MVGQLDTESGHAACAGRAHATFGKGVSFMHNLVRWHYMPMSDAEYAQAMSEIGASE